ncbi:UbiH/UbiF family hydroxylase [Bartonella sp. HY329]|uniref:UbiH/UbiF family hydroxylase n=1 Tax=unclassified Bartonella TaxID=2645622 RepID=UPI0021C69459|nr:MULTISPECIES: UbiH/UbiF family hydroxylase [unclassified Bartonella]UXM96148.1 UbiH/UbiF family hydroxylase [Bartonella sp. HY329]UXN10472.1 UbiH/UbiF family hydroxylase [Bartonella sp. HY328]
MQDADISLNTKSKIAIVGAGPAGMFAALKLAGHFDNILLIGPSTDQNDMRTTALMMPAIKQLDEIGIWQDLASKAAPLATMRIIDGTKRLIRSPCVTFRASEINEQAFGFNIPNISLNAALKTEVEQCKKITQLPNHVTHYEHLDNEVQVTLDNGDIITTQLLVAADGRNSAAREAASIETRQWAYPQTAVILSFSHPLPHLNTSTEFHTSEGPFTQVPLPGNKSSLVWVQKPEKANRLLGLGPEALARQIEEKMGSMLGKVTIETPVQAWPMGGAVPKYFARNRTILIGEAAHVFPPIGAQGLNLGIRDVVDLTNAAAKNLEDPGSDNAINDYNRHRKPDIWARTGFVHLLNRALLSDFLPVQMVRSGGLELLRQFSPLRTLFMHEAMQPGQGFSCLKPKFLKQKA